MRIFIIFIDFEIYFIPMFLTFIITSCTVILCSSDGPKFHASPNSTSSCSSFCPIKRYPLNGSNTCCHGRSLRISNANFFCLMLQQTLCHLLAYLLPNHLRQLHFLHDMMQVMYYEFLYIY